jgi:hypothetical protein
MAHPRHALIAALALGSFSVFSTGCVLRATDRVSEIEISQEFPIVGTVKSTYEITYHDDGTIDEVEVRNNSGDRTRRVTFTWEGDRLTEVEVDDESGNWDAEVEYDGDRPTLLTANRTGGADLDIEVEYDTNDRNRPTRIVTTREDGAQTDTTDVQISYNDQGRIGDTETEITSENDDSGSSSETNEEHVYRYNDNQWLEKVDRTREAGNGQDEDRARFFYNDEGTLEETEDYAAQEATLEYDDEGRIDQINGKEFNFDVEFRYDEGSTRGFTFAPTTLPESGLFDIRGFSHGLIDIRSEFVSILVVE